ncbi:MAG: thioether cross-link-forming SCIFF peptide maturase [Heliobacteriaceae bacterium]|nr:thioether cross-link-forming SCIFF peptide maturase [Heliobacteriaceae bacterium]
MTAWWNKLDGYDFPAHVFTFSYGETAFCYDVNSGSLHRFDLAAKLVLDTLAAVRGDGEAVQDRLAGSFTQGVIEEILAELGDLEAKGLLFTDDALARQYAGCRPVGEPTVKALCLHVAHDCNLCCRYCFAGTGPFGGDRSLMSPDIGRQAIDFLLRNSQGRQQIEIDFFGGEPLLNFTVVQELVRYAKERSARAGKSLKLTLTTNGVLLDADVGRFLNAEGLAVVLSLDGRPVVHDRMRPDWQGRGSYQDVVANLQAFVRSRPDGEYYVRGTFTRFNPDFARDALHIHDLGFNNLSVEPVVASPKAHYALCPEDLPLLDEQYRELAEASSRYAQAGRPFNFFHFQLDLAGGPCLAKRLSGCGAGFEYLAVAPNGDLYPCHQFVGREKFRLGHITTGFHKMDTSGQFQQAHIYNKQGCSACWARFLCSGGCHANNVAATGDLLVPARLGCDLARLRLKWALYAKVLAETKGD